MVLVSVPLGYIPHGHCYLWQPRLVGLHLISDLLIAIAYYSIPIGLLVFIRQRSDIPFKSIFILFSAFILSCGTTHLLSIWTLWHPDYWLEGLLKASTASISLYTAIVLMPIIPKALSLPSPAKLEALNAQLRQENEERQATEAAMRNLLSAMYDLVLIRDREGRCLEIAPTHFKRWVADKNKILQATLHDVMPTATADFVLAQIQQALDNQCNVRCEYVLPIDESEVYFSASIAPIDTQKVVLVVRDITEMKQVEMALQTSEQRLLEHTAELEQINTDLRQRKAILRSFFNSAAMPMGIIELHDNDILHISDNWAAAQNLGCTPDEMESKFASQLGATPATVERWRGYCRESEHLQSPVRFEYHHDAPNGRRWWAGSVCPIKVHAGDHPRFSFIAEDITERKEAADILALKEEQLRLALEFTHIGAWDWDVVTDNVTWNENHFRLLGLEPDSATQNLYQIWRKAVHPEDVERVEQTLLTALQHHTDYETEYRVIYPDGSVHWLVGRGRGLYDSAQNPLRMLGVIIDISDRKQAEQEQEFQAVITRNMAEGICVVRVDDGIIAYANPKFEQMFGYDPGELNGKHVSIVNYATEMMSAEAVKESIFTDVIEHQEASYEVHNVKKDGTPFWCSATTSIFEHLDYGSVLVAVHQDITDKKAYQEQLQSSLQEKELLLKEIYHRVKNNLQVVYSLLDLQAHGIDDAAAQSVLKDSQSRIRAMALVHEKLYKAPDLARINLTDYIESLVYSLLETYQVTSGRISFQLDLTPCSLDIETALPCGLILVELISNALKYAFPDSRSGIITITSSVQPDQQISLTVKDDGIGLSKDFAVQNAASLGLSLVRNLTKQIKGTVQIHSPAVGTTFQLSFSP